MIVNFSCNKKSEIKDLDLVKLEITKTEKKFEKIVSQKGLAEGFYQFADSNATIKREHDTLITGRDNIKNYYSNPKFKNTTVTWEPDFVGVANEGDLAYTYGNFIWITKDSIGKEQVFKGVFHTVWKKQKDGSWKYVWD